MRARKNISVLLNLLISNGISNNNNNKFIAFGNDICAISLIKLWQLVSMLEIFEAVNRSNAIVLNYSRCKNARQMPFILVKMLFDGVQSAIKASI